MAFLKTTKDALCCTLGLRISLHVASFHARVYPTPLSFEPFLAKAPKENFHHQLVPGLEISTCCPSFLITSVPFLPNLLLCLLCSCTTSFPCQLAEHGLCYGKEVRYGLCYVAPEDVVIGVSGIPEDGFAMWHLVRFFPTPLSREPFWSPNLSRMKGDMSKSPNLEPNGDKFFFGCLSQKRLTKAVLGKPSPERMPHVRLADKRKQLWKNKAGTREDLEERVPL